MERAAAPVGERALDYAQRSIENELVRVGGQFEGQRRAVGADQPESIHDRMTLPVIAQLVLLLFPSLRQADVERAAVAKHHHARHSVAEWDVRQVQAVLEQVEKHRMRIRG